MESLLLIPAGVLATAGVLFHITHAAFGREDFGRNRAVGLRTRATLASDEAWREGHRTAAPLVLAAALTAYASAAVCAAVAVATRGDVSEVVVGVVPGIGFLSVFVLLVSAGRSADKAARSAGSPTDELDCREVEGDCRIAAVETLTPTPVRSTAPVPTLCGRVVLVVTVPVPWAFRDDYDGWRLDARATVLEVTCASS